jgi:serine/threonine-protein kinase
MSLQAVTPAPRPAVARILHDPLPGTGYRALRRIGAGSSSEVFEAVGPDRLRRAVKVLRALHSDSPDAVFRMEQEGHALAALQHPSLVPVIDLGTTLAGRPYFVMPLLEGETVRERLARRGPIPPALACAVLAEVLEGLDVAHRGGVVHRDVKPGNVFLPLRRPLTRAPRAVLLDFGVAKVLGATGRETTEARVVGTPRYLSPEQILGGRVDARTDVYAAGLTLFEMIAGRGPFEASGPIELMRAHLDQAPRSLRALAPVSEELAHAVERAIAKAPGRRWPSARAFAAVLDRAAAREVAKAREAALSRELEQETAQ